MAQLKKHGVQGQTAPALAAEIAQLILASPQLPYTVAAGAVVIHVRFLHAGNSLMCPG